MHYFLFLIFFNLYQDENSSNLLTSLSLVSINFSQVFVLPLDNDFPAVYQMNGGTYSVSKVS